MLLFAFGDREGLLRSTQQGRDMKALWVLVATIVGSSLAFIDGAVVTLALPQIQSQFHASASDVAWIVELYTLVLGSLMLLGGALADRYGRKRVFIAGVTLFAIGSIGCAFASSIPAMLVARVIQGLGGTCVAPASLAIIGAQFRGEARGRAIAAWSAFGALTSSLGPMLGGILIDTLGWRSVFWINIPLAAIVVYAATFHVEESRDENAPRHLDALGAALTTLALGAITYALIIASSFGWGNVRASGSIVAGIVLLVVFVVHERRSASPLVPPDIFASRTFGAINLATLFLYGALGALFYELPFVMIQTHGYSALRTAIATLPMIACLVLLARVGTGLARRIGVRRVLSIGPAIVAAGFVLLALFNRNASYLTSFFPGILCIGIGMGITVAPLTASVIDAANPRHVGIASGINNAVARIAGLLAIAALIVVVANVYNASLDRSLDAMRATPAQRADVAAQREKLGGARFSDPALQRASTGAFESGFSAVAYACAVLALLAAVVDGVAINDAELHRV